MNFVHSRLRDLVEGTKASLTGGVPGGRLAQALWLMPEGEGPPAGVVPPGRGRELCSHCLHPSAHLGLCHRTSRRRRGGVSLGVGVDGQGGAAGKSSVLAADRPGGPSPQVPVEGPLRGAWPLTGAAGLCVACQAGTQWPVPAALRTPYIDTTWNWTLWGQLPRPATGPWSPGLSGQLDPELSTAILSRDRSPGKGARGDKETGAVRGPCGRVSAGA